MLQYQRTILFIGDVIALVLAFVAMIAIRFNEINDHAIIVHQGILFGWLFLIWLLVFFIFDLYNLRRVNPNPRNIGLLLVSTLLNTLLGVAFFYIFSNNSGITPKTNLLLVSLFAFLLLAVWRRLFYHLFTVRFTRTIATIGISPLITDLQAELERNPHFGEHIVHWNTIEEVDLSKPVDILIAENTDAQKLLTTTMSLGAEPLTLTESYETFFAKIPLSLVTNEKATTLMTKHQSKATYFFYRVAEVLLASIVLIVASPFLLIAIIARLIEDGRPILYTHKRVGKNGRLFTVYKIRSMTKDAEKENGAQWAQHKDPRITTVGKILRKTHIDEVPQMINIIKGDIAIVGPRPERPEFVSQLEKEVPYYFLRHTIRPGFTGWAQIKYRYARSADDAREKFEYDLYYIKHRNPLLDVGIILKTLQIIFTH
ncbi:MAG TPA: exopolysaccharide biosynthesis polyprenyl glycosylphosphotransferase [Candidatus Paceibacterota bacterium]|jgi:exopolysaccharide biosynthesis polyprenyl glycosylphosphotransferase|nr:exopolysaccharide biosynthesis polyprenyl glycosylphosphotransferase [Candidatus Paceibacterota bacterium]